MADNMSTEINVQAEDAVVEIPIYPDFEAESYYKKPSKRKLFWKLFVAYFALLLVIGVFALWFFYRDLSRYESSTPGNALNTYVDWVKNKDFESIYAASEFEESIFNTKDEYLKYLQRLYSGNVNTLVVREKVTSTDDQKDYSLYIDGKRVSSLSLIRNPEWGETDWSYQTEVTYLSPVTIYTGDDVRLTINGTDATLLNLVATPAQSEVFNITEATDALPTVYGYTIEQLLNPPTIEGLTFAGDVCNVVQDEAGNYHVVRTVNSETQTEREKLANEVAFTYAKFISRDAKREDVLKHIVKNSELYKKVKAFSNDWFSRHDKVEFRDVSVSGYKQYSNNEFSCDIRFTPVYFRGGQEKETSSFNNRLTFVSVNGDWQLIAMEQLTEAATDETPSSETTGTTTTTP